jgi:aspartate aminotransferase-like enzyme
VEKLGELAKDSDALYIVDSVCGLGGMPLKMDEWNIAFCLTGSQKAIGAPPGISLFCLNDRAWKIVENRKDPVNDYYVNLKRWRPVMDNPRGYFATPAVGMVLAMLEALKMVHEEGLEARWRRHELFSDAFRAGLSAIGVSSFPEEGFEAHTLSVPEIPEGVDEQDLRGLMRIKYGVTIAGGIGKLRGETVRVGHMGNATVNDIVATLSTFEMSLMELGYDIKPGTGVGAAEKILVSHRTEA